MNEYNQPSKKPTSKVTFGAIGGGLAAISLGTMAIIDPEMYTRVPPGFEAGIATTISFLFSYFKRDKA